ncbi:MAG: hypothetical protein LW806_11425 [Planctomycetaceae bacterium]|nr:hypothetical protein [Planctomycetaceae bacterium]
MQQRKEQLPPGFRGFLVRLGRIDRRWIYLAVAVAIGVPMLAELRLPEVPEKKARATFEAIESIPEGSIVLLSFDYDPASEAELEPMANAMVHHCASKGHRIVFMALWPLGKQMADKTIDSVLKYYHPDKVEGVDYAQLGFKTGNEGVIKLLANSIDGAYTTDAAGTAISEIPLLANVRSVGDFKLVASISAGYPGAQQWVQYADSAMPEAFKLVGGTTGVQSSQLLPYFPTQMEGMLIAVKGAAEYETLVTEKYPVTESPERLGIGRERMGPQLVAHLLIIALIVLGNISMLAARGLKGGAR